MEIKTTWDLSSLKENFKQAKEENIKFIQKWQKRTDFLEQPIILKEALDEYELLERNFGPGGDAFFLLSLQTVLNQNNPIIKAKYNKLHQEIIKLVNDLEFFTLKLSKIPEKTQTQFLNDPNLKEYKHFLERLFVNAKYLLSEPEEKILNLKSKVAHENWVEMLENILSKEERDGKNFAEILDLLSNSKKAIRDNAAKDFNSILETHLDEAEHEINAILENNRIDMNLRGFKSPEEPRHVADDIDPSVIETLIKTVEESFIISRRFYELKAKLLNQEKLSYHERNVPYGNLDKTISFEEAVRIVKKSLLNLDPQFSNLFEKYLSNGQIDAFPKKHKDPGGACISNLQRQPIFIYLNFLGKIRDITTIAHEMGHAIHFELAKTHQNALNDGASLAIAEVASTFMEDFVLQEISQQIDEETLLSLQMERLNDQVSSIQRQIACYKFELDLHREHAKKGYLPAKFIGELFQENMKAYMGDFVEQSKGSENWWVYWSHIRNFFYVYSYASGLLISKSLQSEVNKNPKFIEKFKTLLSLGASVSPADAFKKVGIDIEDKNFWAKGIKEQEKLLDDTWTLAKKLGKI